MEAVTTLVLWVLGLFALYFVVRAAVKGGILDADRERARERPTRAPTDGSTP